MVDASREGTHDVEFAASPFFVVRTPLLPLGALTALSEDLLAPDALPAEGGQLDAAIAHDQRIVRERLRRAVLEPAVAESLYLASPTFDGALQAWLADPDGSRAHHVVETLLRYFTRMCARPTPFGLFAGCSVGSLGRETRFELAPRDAYVKRTRLDMHYVSALAEGLESDRALRPRLTYRPNSTLYTSAGQIRYAESRFDGDTKERRNDLVSVDMTPHLDAALARASGGATPSELATAVVERLGQESAEEAGEFVDTLIDNQVIVSELAPNVTGQQPIQSMMTTLRAAGESAQAEKLGQVDAALDAMDAGGIGLPVQRYRAVAELLGELPAEVDAARLFQVDLHKPSAHATLGGAALREIERAVALLRRVTPAGELDALRRFRQAFAGRYGNGEVPLTVALDHERGIGFDTSTEGAEPSPLLRGLPFDARENIPRVPFGPREQWILQRCTQVVQEGGTEWVLSERDLIALDAKNDLPLPDAYSALVVLAGSSSTAVDRGDVRVWIEGTMGPSGAKLLGRFCQGDDALQRAVEEHLRAEEALRPDAVFAEIVHLPQGRLGNVLCRPVLRGWEIPYLGRSGAPRNRQISLADLRVSVPDKMGERVRLRSERLDKEVLVRLTSAHNYLGADLPIYRFLCALQSQGSCGDLGWSWGPLSSARFLPRVAHGNVVLSLAQWNLRDDDLAPILTATGSERYRRVQELRERCHLSRWVAVSDGDNVLPLDLDNVVAVDVLAQLSKQRSRLKLTEPFLGPQNLCVEGPEGRFAHELLVPFVRARGVSSLAVPAERPRQARASLGVTRSFPPGSEWLYARIYTGTMTADAVITDLARPLANRAIDRQAADQWFFIRYGEGGWQVRLRLHGVPDRLTGEVLPELLDTTAAWRADGRISRIELDTYDREVERYGGEAGIDLAERMFHVDSDAVASIVESLAGDEGADLRWRVALVGIDKLLEGFGLDLAGRIDTMTRLRRAFGITHKVDVAFESRLGAKFRTERQRIEPLLAEGGPATDDPLLQAPIAALAQRAQRLVPLFSELHRRERAGDLTVPSPLLADSHVHMFTNRLLRSEHLAHELVLYDFLLRVYQSQAARRKARR